MLTFQDLQAVGEGEQERMSFVWRVIYEHQSSKMYKTARIAEEYAKHQNRTIMQYQKLLYTVSGKAVPDSWSANYKIPSNFFSRFVTQQNQFLLGNGATWNEESTPAKLGEDFDTQLQKAGKQALICGESFGFFNLDHVEVFSLLEFAPLYDEENGALSAGVRFWQIDSNKPLRATLYEIDGYTDYIWIKNEGKVLTEKRAYKINVTFSEVDGTKIYSGENYPAFPVVPFYGNYYKQSEIIGIREQIDAYDLIKSGFANDLDDASLIYWVVENAGGMDDIDLAQFLQRLRTTKAASVQDGEKVEAHTVNVPYDGREAILDRLRRDLYRNYMALDIDSIASGAATATQIRAAYEPINSKADEYEYCVLEYIQGILRVAGIEDTPTFTRSILVNQAEEIQNLVTAGEYLDSQYITEKVLTIMGDADKVEEVLSRMAADEIDRGFIDRPGAEEEDEVNGEEET